MIHLSPLIVGTHRIAGTTEEMVTIAPHTSSVTLLQTDEQNILVDTGGRGALRDLEQALAKKGLTKNNIDIVILTHFHLDHAYNVSAFAQARVIGWRHEWQEKTTLRFKNVEKIAIAPGIRLLPTPGHAEEHLAVAVTQEDGTIIMMGGDAINESYARTKKIASLVYDEALYRANADRILEMADLIIPGHGKPFSTI